MFEQIFRTHIPQRVDAPHRGALVLIDRHTSLRIERQARRRHVELIAVGRAPRGDQQYVAGHRRPIAEVYLDTAASGLTQAHCLGVQPHVPPLRDDLGETPRNGLVLSAQQARAARNHGDLRAQPTEHMRELRGDETAAHDQYPSRQFRQPHDVVVGVVRHAACGDHRRNDRPRTGRDHHLPRLQHRPVAQLETVHRVAVGIGPRLDEPRFLLKDSDIRAILHAIAQSGRRDGIDPAEDPIPDIAPPGAVNRAVHAQPCALTCLIGQVRRIDEHLGRDATDVQTGTAVRASVHAPIDDRYLLVGEPIVGQGVCAAGTDDDEVVHLLSIS
ncbi:Uncharacterised protein [Mycobacteroides abscessus subsp. abscessus]|nr:Uncharacterised protein [Mycobacteroides abscessus subsp. abscessus]